ncbi:hypothetical protein ACFLRO_00485 [Bacteroidota bacterium]
MRQLNPKPALITVLRTMERVAHERKPRPRRSMSGGVPKLRAFVADELDFPSARSLAIYITKEADNLGLRNRIPKTTWSSDWALFRLQVEKMIGDKENSAR